MKTIEETMMSPKRQHLNKYDLIDKLITSNANLSRIIEEKDFEINDLQNQIYNLETELDELRDQVSESEY